MAQGVRRLRRARHRARRDRPGHQARHREDPGGHAGAARVHHPEGGRRLALRPSRLVTLTHQALRAWSPLPQCGGEDLKSPSPALRERVPSAARRARPLHWPFRRPRRKLDRGVTIREASCRRARENNISRVCVNRNGRFGSAASGSGPHDAIPGCSNGARAIAALYDMQHDPELRDEMTYVSPSSGDRVGLSFIIPRTREDLEKRRVMMLNWARATCGMMGRSPDFMNVTYAAWAGAAGFFAQGRGPNGREHAALLRIHPRERPHSDALADQFAAQPNRHRRLQPRGRDGAAGGARDRCRHCRARRPHPRDLGAAGGRDRGLFAAHGTAHREPQPVRPELCDPVRHAGAQIPVPRELRSRPVAFRPSARLAL